MGSYIKQPATDLPSEEKLFKLINAKPSPSWQIDSKESTPEYIGPDCVDEAAYWRRVCEENRQRLLDCGLTSEELEDIRCANPNANASYWKLEAELFDDEFWKVQQHRQAHIKRRNTTKHFHETKPSLGGDDRPVSSRLRKRTSRDGKVMKNSDVVKQRKTRRDSVRPTGI